MCYTKFTVFFSLYAFQFLTFLVLLERSKKHEMIYFCWKHVVFYLDVCFSPVYRLLLNSLFLEVVLNFEEVLNHLVSCFPRCHSGFLFHARFDARWKKMDNLSAKYLD